MSDLKKRLTAKQIVEQHAGWKVEASSVPLYKAPKAYARIVGLLDSVSVVIQFDDEDLRKACWPLMSNSGVKLCVGEDELLEPANIWSVSPAKLKLIEPGKTPKKYVIVPYPDRCRSCSSPARKAGGMVMCSNLQCKTRFKRPQTTAPRVQIIKCPKCSSKAIRFKWPADHDGPIETSTKWVMECSVIHPNRKRKYSWKHELKANDIVAQSYIQSGLADMVWNGKEWSIY